MLSDLCRQILAISCLGLQQRLNSHQLPQRAGQVDSPTMRCMPLSIIVKYVQRLSLEGVNHKGEIWN